MARKRLVSERHSSQFSRVVLCARALGMCFVLIGGGFAFYHTGQIYSLTQAASVGDAAGLGSTTSPDLENENNQVSNEPINEPLPPNGSNQAEFTEDDDDETEAGANDPDDDFNDIEQFQFEASADPEPAVEVDLPGEVNEVVDIEISVVGAHRIKVFLRDMQTGTNHFAGMAERTGNNEWIFFLEPEQFEEGNYGFGVLVTNDFGSYDRQFGSVFIAGHSSTDNVIDEDFETPDTDNSTLETTQTDAAESVTDEQEDTDSTGQEEFDTNEDNDALIQEPQTIEPDTAVFSDEVVVPEFGIALDTDEIINGTTRISISATNALFIEVYVSPRFGGTERFVGLAERVDRNEWLFSFNTENTPNGQYRFFVKAKTELGFFTSDSVNIIVKNEEVFIQTEDQKVLVESIRDQKQIVEPIEKELELEAEEAQRSNTIIPANDNEIDVVETQEQLRAVLNDETEAEIEDALNRLAVSVRTGDEEDVEKARNNLRVLKEEIKTETGSDNEDVLEEIDNVIAERESRTIRHVEIIKDRVDEDVFKDSDQDGVSDYDEVHLYETDPFAADSDGDGFVDGAEILNGFDPKDDTPEALVTFESPKEVGVTRDDILVVEKIVSVDSTPGSESPEANIPKAVISGTALPNSFVTLYIFSSPVIVTVKTDADGSWEYTFDKELEDGAHEVYVGITDNAGRIVAKSNPLAFVKEAQAFSPVDAAEDTVLPVAASTDSARSQTLLSDYMILLVLSVAVIAIGLVLILLGMFYGTREHLKAAEAV